MKGGKNRWREEKRKKRSGEGEGEIETKIDGEKKKNRSGGVEGEIGEGDARMGEGEGVGWAGLRELRDRGV